MNTYQLTGPLVGMPLGEKEPITMPAGTLVEHEAYLQSVGPTVVLLEGKSMTVMAQDFLSGAQSNAPEPGDLSERKAM